MKEEIYTEQLKRGNRTYFFDIKRASNEVLYLTITESKKKDSDYEKFKLMVFEEDLDQFITTLNTVNEGLKLFKKTTQKKDYSVEKIRAKYPNAYKPWTKEVDEKLELLFCEGKSISELSKIFKRNEGAINSRIEKLELNEKYN
jgi:ASC-1-like (ASCH) protein